MPAGSCQQVRHTSSEPLAWSSTRRTAAPYPRDLNKAGNAKGRGGFRSHIALAIPVAVQEPHWTHCVIAGYRLQIALCDLKCRRQKYIKRPAPLLAAGAISREILERLHEDPDEHRGPRAVRHSGRGARGSGG